jgi:hypothetical protein
MRLLLYADNRGFSILPAASATYWQRASPSCASHPYPHVIPMLSFGQSLISLSFGGSLPSAVAHAGGMPSLPADIKPQNNEVPTLDALFSSEPIFWSTAPILLLANYPPSFRDAGTSKWSHPDLTFRWRHRGF